MSTEEEINPYELMKLEAEATEQDIRTAYRKLSLKVHPDRNPNNPDAARLFHELNQAYELLLDPLRRMAVDAKLRVKRARAERYKSYDNKRKNMVEELEARERAFKKAKLDTQKEEAKRQHDTERIKEEGRKLREQKEKELLERTKAEKQYDEDLEMDMPELHSLDTTVRLKWSVKVHPELATPEAIAKLLAPFGALDAGSIVLSLKAPKKAPNKPPKTGTALAPFKQIGDAFAAVCASGRMDRQLEGIEIGWVNGKEPQILGWLKKMGKLGSAPKPESNTETDTSGAKAELPQNQVTGSSGFSTFPSTMPDLSADMPMGGGIDYESATLMRLRQAERERLEREIREQEAAE